MKLTKNQEAIKEFGKSVEIWITTNRKEKRFQWDNCDFGICENCGEERHLGEPWEEKWMCWECFNSHKLPLMSYDTSTYSNWVSGETLLDWFKADKPIKEVETEFDEMKKENEEGK